MSLKDPSKKEIRKSVELLSSDKLFEKTVGRAVSGGRRF